MPRPPGRVVLAILFVLLGLNAWLQLPFSDEPRVLDALQVAIGLAAMAAARGSWSGARWAPAAALAYGAFSASMLLALPTILSLEPDARPGLFTGAGVVALAGLGSAWYLRRLAQRDAGVHRPRETA